MNVAVEDDCVLKLERHLKATPETVFAAWVEPEQIAKWFGPGDATIPSQEIDARVGGAWQVTMRMSSGMERIVSGVYREIDPPSRLAFTWAWHNDGTRGHETEVVVELTPEDGGTLLSLTQRTFQTSNDRDMHNMGWSYSLTGLADLLAA